MKNISKKFIVLSVITTLFIWSCSTKKDAFLNRTLHSTATKYNVLYNGKNAYNEEKKQIDDSYEDDFWSLLPIEPLEIKEEELLLPETPFAKKTDDQQDDQQQQNSSGFARAEEKAVKSIQKHSMNISGIEKNKQIDDAYFLLGKSRYYDQRFIPALETFKYMINRYPNSKLFNQARVWEAKTLIRLGNEDDAIYKIDRYLIQNNNLSHAIKVDAHTALAMAYTNLDSTQQVVNHLNKSLFTPRQIALEKLDSLTTTPKKIVEINSLNNVLTYAKKDHKQTTRNAFILAQLYRQQNKIDSSNIVFDNIIATKKAPYRYKIYAQIERAKNYNKDTDDTESIVTTLEKLAKNRDNRPYLDGIYYQLGKIKLTNNQIEEASAYFEKSIRTDQAHNFQKGLAHEELGNISFDKANFIFAGSYYDSVLQLTKNKNTLRIRRLTRKRKSLNEVIKYEKTVSRSDSILSLVAMSEDERKTVFNNHIKKIKEEEEEKRIELENKQKNSGFAGDGLNIGSKQGESGGKFYFYNTQVVGFGQKEFQNIWGNRELEDNWRRSNKKATNSNEEEGEEEVTEVEDKLDHSKRFDLDYYLSTVPSDQKQIDSISAKRNKAYYNLGLIYKEQFKKYELATDRLEKLLVNKPKENLILPIYYHLYKSYENFDLPKSAIYKEKIIANFPDSRYAKLVSNPENIALIDDNENSPENIYEDTYCYYEEEKYPKTFEQCNKSIIRFADTPIIPKFELLKAYAIAKLEGREPFIKALTFVSLNFPNTEEGKHALRVLASLRGEIVSTESEKKPQASNPRTEKRSKQNRTKNDKVKRKRKNLPSNEKMMERIKNNKKPGDSSPTGIRS